jgi:hypothetical protein
LGTTRINCRYIETIEKEKIEICVKNTDLIDAGSNVSSALIALIALILTNKKLFENYYQTAKKYINYKDLEAIEVINNYLEDIRIKLKADRVVIGIIKGGIKLEQIEKQELIVLFEAHDKLLSSLKKQYPCIDRDIIQEEIKASQAKKNNFITFSIDKCNQLCRLYMESIEAKIVKMKMLEDKKGSYGVIQIHYREKANDTYLNKENQKEIKDLEKWINIYVTRGHKSFFKLLKKFKKNYGFYT